MLTLAERFGLYRKTTGGYVWNEYEWEVADGTLRLDISIDSVPEAILNMVDWVFTDPLWACLPDLQGVRVTFLDRRNRRVGLVVGDREAATSLARRAKGVVKVFHGDQFPRYFDLETRWRAGVLTRDAFLRELRVLNAEAKRLYEEVWVSVNWSFRPIEFAPGLSREPADDLYFGALPFDSSEKEGW